THFHGLPSPTAGMILATFYPFSQTVFFQTYLGDLPWSSIMGVVTVILSVLLMSHIPYALFPRIGFRTAKGRFSTVVVLGGLFLAITVPRYYFFPVLVLYTSWGLLKALLLGLLDRLPDRDPLLDEEDEDEDDPRAEVRQMDYSDVAPDRFKRRRRKSHRGRDRGNEERTRPKDTF
ncbi:MAG: hypothetical protein HKO65_10700, partial [Gemmatimonadetes bacterium]|nr:hypothetical protein [Gemmatimonadota bacterium]